MNSKPTQAIAGAADSERGAVAALMAILIVVLLGFAAVAIDIGLISCPAQPP